MKPSDDVDLPLSDGVPEIREWTEVELMSFRRQGAEANAQAKAIWRKLGVVLDPRVQAARDRRSD